MNRSRIASSLLAVVFTVLGFCVGRLSVPHGEVVGEDVAQRKGRDLSDLGSDRIQRGRQGQDGESIRAREVFSENGGRQWMFDLASTSWRADPAGDIQMAQAFVAMGRDEAEEAVREAVQILRDYEEGDPETLRAFKGGRIGHLILLTAFHRLSELDPNGALKVLDESPDVASRGSLLQVAFASFARGDPRQGIEALDDLQEQDFPIGLSALVGVMAQSYPGGALSLLAQYPELDLSQQIHEFIESTVSRNPREALEAIVRTDLGEKSQQHLKDALDEWMAIDREAAMQWAFQTKDLDMTVVNAALITDLADSDPIQAAEQWKSLGSAGDQYAGLAFSIVGRLAEIDMGRAKVWVEGMHDGESKTVSTTALEEKRTQRDPYAASEYLNTLPEGERRDQAVFSFANSARMKFPAEVFEWVQTLPNSPKNKELMEHVMAEWRERDSDAANAACENYEAFRVR